MTDRESGLDAYLPFLQSLLARCPSQFLFGGQAVPILHRKKTKWRNYLAKNSCFPAGSFTGIQSTGTTSPSSVMNTFAGLMSKTA